MFRKSIATFVTALTMISAANATVFTFDGKNPGPVPIDEPSNARIDCGTIGFDFCDVNAEGFLYEVDGITLLAKAFANNVGSVLIQDIAGPNQGLGVLSEGGNSMDQINADTNESILLQFTETVSLSNIELNNGTAQDCPTVGREGGCGLFDLVIDAGLPTTSTLSDIVAIESIAGPYVGSSFEFVATTIHDGFSIEAVTVERLTTPVPGAMVLLFSGLFGLGLASRQENKIQ